MTDMQENLAKLKNLSEDDKTEHAMLRSRINEQSQLIMILKQRSDESVVKIRTLEKMNAELESFRNEATEKFEQELRKFNILDQRFEDLASNHEELIKFKDEYKRQNELLRAENAKLKQDNENLFSKAIQERDIRLSELQKGNEHLKEQCTMLSSKNR